MDYTNQAESSPSFSKGKAAYGMNTLFGIIGACTVLASTFLDFISFSAGFLSFTFEDALTVKIIDLLDAADLLEVLGGTDEALLLKGLTYFIFACVAWVVFFHLIKLPKGSIVGIAGMFFAVAVLLWGIRELIAELGDYSGLIKPHYQIGLIVYIAGIVICFIGMCMKKKRV